MGLFKNNTYHTAMLTNTFKYFLEIRTTLGYLNQRKRGGGGGGNPRTINYVTGDAKEIPNK